MIADQQAAPLWYKEDLAIIDAKVESGKIEHVQWMREINDLEWELNNYFRNIVIDRGS